MKQSTVQHINHDIADFRDRTRHNHAETRVRNSLGAAIVESGEFKDGVQLHQKNQEIRKQNYDALEAGRFHDMTYGFLVKLYNYDKKRKEQAAAELNRRDENQARKDARHAKAEEKKAKVYERNHGALSASPMNFGAMTFGLLKKLANKDNEFMKELTDKGYTVSSLDCMDAGFEIQRRLVVREKKISDLHERIDTLSLDVTNAAEVERLTLELNKLEGVEEAKETW